MATVKGPGAAQTHDGKCPLSSQTEPKISSVLFLLSSGYQKLFRNPDFEIHEGSGLRIAIVHARWNAKIVSALVDGAVKSMLAAGVKRENIVVQDVPGSYELPFAVQR